MESEEDEVVRDEDEVLLSGTRKRRFDQQQIASLTAYYNTGMKGEGEQYSSKINHAAAETGLTVTQVKVYLP